MSEAKRAVFLSYASQDAAAAARICDALRAGGIEVWFDQSELRGGDVWDAAIRRQIKACALFMPIISNHTHARGEGYFRLEWKLAVDRSHLMALDQPFLLPVAIDDTGDAESRVPEKFRDVQWTRLPAGDTPAAFVERVRRLLAGDAAAPAAAPRAVGAHSAPAAITPPTAVQPAVAPATLAAAMPRRSRTKLAVVGLVVIAGLAIAGVAAKRVLSHSGSVVPYSIEDRRMTFAILPFQGPADDPRGTQVAKATAEEIVGIAEADALWAQVTPRRSVEQAVAKTASVRGLAKALDVHFLIRGNVARAAPGYTATVTVSDGETERTLGTKTLTIAADALTPRWREDVEDALYGLYVVAMEAEVKRARDRAPEALDVRDLSFRAFVGWRARGHTDAKGAYGEATELLQRALALAPDDPLAVFLTADINLCDCVMAWSANPEEQQAIGAKAMEAYLRIDPTSREMLADKALVYQLRGRFEESLLIADSLLQRDPEMSDALAIKATGLLKLGRPQEALPLVTTVLARHPNDWGDLSALAAAVHYALADYAAAEALAQKAVTQMSERMLRSRRAGAVRLTLIAAEGRLGHAQRAKAAFADFRAAVPGVDTVTAIRKWVFSSADLAGFEPLYDGLRLAGIPD